MELIMDILKNDNQYAIVVIGYNRPEGIYRLLCSLEKAYYDEPVDLIISIDNSGRNDVEKVAEDFSWSFGEKRIITYPEKQGLRNHILHCGDFVNEYRAIAVLEDDIIVSPGFFLYLKKCVEKYSQDDNIAGISLYNNLFNQNSGMVFEPALSQYDIYFMQYAQSWGQVWMRDQWLAFKEWYSTHNEPFAVEENIPKNVCKWPKSSWLKYHIKYCIETNKFFVYPYKSLTTCFGDVGQHNKEHNKISQVPLLYGVQTEYKLPDLVDAPVKYDAFFERIISANIIDGISSSDICVDLYGERAGYLKKRYVLSTRILPYNLVCSFGMELKPIEMNVLENIKGSGIFLYDTREPKKKKSKKSEMSLEEFKYRLRLTGKTKLLLKMVLDNLKRKIFKKKK